MDEKMKGILFDKDVLVWSHEDAELLRITWRISGGNIGALPQNPRQNIQLGLPLALMAEEVILLCDKGVLEVHENSPHVTNETEDKTATRHQLQQHSYMINQSQVLERLTPCSKLKVSLFRDLWENGYHLTSGLKYGGDYLIYHDDPSTTHASYIAIVLPWKQPIRNFISLGRVGAKVKKNILLCTVDKDQPCYYTVAWAGL